MIKYVGTLAGVIVVLSVCAVRAGVLGNSTVGFVYSQTFLDDALRGTDNSVNMFGLQGRIG